MTAGRRVSRPSEISLDTTISSLFSPVVEEDPWYNDGLWRASVSQGLARGNGEAEVVNDGSTGGP